MMAFRNSLLVFALIGCEAQTPAPSPAATPAAAPAPDLDRRKDPAFALKKDGNKFIGRVADECPWHGRPAQKPWQQVLTLKPADYKLVGTTLEVTLPYGGCPLWTGFTVVTGPGSPLPFYVCAEFDHDTCELAGNAVWEFDLSSQLKANHATAVSFEVPTGVH